MLEIPRYRSGSHPDSLQGLRPYLFCYGEVVKKEAGVCRPRNELDSGEVLRLENEVVEELIE